jgi:hypothetical protein
LVIEGTAGRADAPPATAPSIPSLESEIERGWFFDSRTGELLKRQRDPADRDRSRLAMA